MGKQLKRASSDKLRQIFAKYASIKKDGELYMTSEDFVRKFLGLFTDTSYNLESVKLISGVADTTKNGLISFAEFQAFEGLLCTPDAIYRTAFQMFDRKGNGVISYNEFAEVIQKTELNTLIPFSLDGPFIKHYFGSYKTRLINYAEFTQLLHDFHEEHAREAFIMKDNLGTGYISSMDFQDVIIKVKKNVLTPAVKENLVSITQGKKVSYPYFMAFTSLMNNMELVKSVYLHASKGSRNSPIAKDELLLAAQTMSQLTPLEVDIVYQLTRALRQSGRIVYSDLSNIAFENYTEAMTKRKMSIGTVDSSGHRSVFIQILESVYRFSLGAIAGGFGAACVYPIDLVKTRMQNQRKNIQNPGNVVYKNMFDCFMKVIRNEGPLGLYRGLLPQVMGVAPEKAIKLTMNDFVRDKFTDKQGKVPLYGEILGGASAGTCQVLITNPLEIVKIRLQTAGEVAGGVRPSALNIIRSLGIRGLYKGARACLMRDIPFAAIYFPVYAHTKVMLADPDGYNTPLSLLCAGAISGVPAASLVTPADVIKTRLQVVARTGQTQYKGVIDAAHKIWREEGPRAFWKGVAARVCRSSPQFGVTLFTYELLQRWLYVDFGGNKPTGMTHGKVSEGPTFKKNPDHIGGYRVALPLLNSIESKFGLSLPRVK